MMARSQEAFKRRLARCFYPKEARDLIKEGATLDLADPALRVQAERWLASACQSEDRELAQFFIKRGVSLEMINKRGKNLLCQEISRCSPFAGGHPGSALLIIGLGADVNAVGEDGGSALMSAALAESPELVEALIRAGADVNHVTESGLSALMLAADTRGEPGVKMVQALLSAGADPLLKDREGRDAMRYALGDDEDEDDDGVAAIISAWIERGDIVSALSAGGDSPARAGKARL